MGMDSLIAGCAFWNWNSILQARQAGLEPAAGFRQGINSPSPATNSGIAELGG